MRRRVERGQAIVLIALMMSVLVGFIALAINTSQILDARRVLTDSVDAASVAAADALQFKTIGSSPDWKGAERVAINLFETNNRLYSGESCSFNVPPPSPATTTCSWSQGYQLTIKASDLGKDGESFVLSANGPPIGIAFAVLNGLSTVSVSSSSISNSNSGNLAVSPTLAGLSQAGCNSVTGAIPLSITNGTISVKVIGDSASNGTFNIESGSTLSSVGDVLTGCAPPTNATNITYSCYPTGAPPPCGAGSNASTANYFPNPAYPAPPAPSGTVGFSSANVVLGPGIYTIDPYFGSAAPTCYFLNGGVYEWQNGMTVNQGLISNELKPPDEPAYDSNTNRSLHQFWDDNGASCGSPAGGSSSCSVVVFTGCSVSLGSGNSPMKGITNGTWSVVVTSIQTATYNGSSSLRESAPSMCHQISISGSDKTLAVTVSNVPGATGYNVYAAPPSGGGCAGPFGLVQPSSITNNAAETQPSSGGSLGTAGGSWDNTTLFTGWTPKLSAPPDTMEAYSPDSEVAPWNGSLTLPNQSPARATYPAGDRANENYCATSSGASTACPAAVTPGAVVMYLTNNSCLTIKSNLLAVSSGGVGGDAYLFSGYQYGWMLNYEPSSTTCGNTWRGFVNTAAIGLSYTPGAAFSIASSSGFSSYTGGVIAQSILIQSASGLLIDFKQDYAPTANARLTG